MPGNLMQTIWVFDSNVEPVFHLPSTFIPIDGDPGATGSSCRASLLLCLTKRSMKTSRLIMRSSLMSSVMAKPT